MILFFFLCSKTYIEKSDSKENKIKEMTTAKAQTEKNSKKEIDVESMKRETELSNIKVSYTEPNILSKLPLVIVELDGENENNNKKLN